MGWLNFSFGNDNSVGVEEAYIQTTSLGEGVTLRAGRMFSGIAYLNERHAHDWSFSDASLPYRAFLNNQYGDDGVQARWLAPANIFLEFGAEAFRGASFPAGGAASHGKGTMTAFVHAGDDINEFQFVVGRTVLSQCAQRTARYGRRSFLRHRQSGYREPGLQMGARRQSHGAKSHPIGRYFFGRESGSFNGIRLDSNRDGWYLQGVYQFMPRWSFGLRYAQLGTGNIGPGLAGSVLDDLGHTPRAETALLEFDTSEFGRLRLQYNHDDSDIKPLDEILFQYTVIYGPHPAHRY